MFSHFDFKLFSTSFKVVFDVVFKFFVPFYILLVFFNLFVERFSTTVISDLCLQVLEKGVFPCVFPKFLPISKRLPCFSVAYFILRLKLRMKENRTKLNKITLNRGGARTEMSDRVGVASYSLWQNE